MTTRSTGATGGTDGPTGPRGLRRVVFGALVGTALEWYDFFIYGTAAALVFNVLFFPQSDPAIGTITAFATFGVGFVFRPLGGIIFGHIGDRIGRRATLILTTLVMGLSTGVIGLLPTYDTIGVWAPVLLVLLRVLQGLGAGAEFGGASTLLAEHAPPHRRGYYCSYAQLGVQVGLVLATVSFLLVGLLPEEQLLSWGWRVPFLVSFLMIGVALYVRLRVEESPVFRAMVAEQTIIELPVLETLRTYPRARRRPSRPDGHDQRVGAMAAESRRERARTPIMGHDQPHDRRSGAPTAARATLIAPNRRSSRPARTSCGPPPSPDRRSRRNGRQMISNSDHQPLSVARRRSDLPST